MSIRVFREIRVPKALATGLLLALAAVFIWKAEQNYLHQDYVNSNFFSFWLSGHMVWTGQSPYNPVQFLAGFRAAGATYIPSKILQDPLPLMYLLAPIGALSVGLGYLVWQFTSEVIIAVCVFILLRLVHRPAWLAAPISVFLLYFGPVYLTLQIGAIGAIALLSVALAIVCLETDRPLLGGLALSLTLLKPPQALTLLALAGIWLLARRQWKAIAGLILGGLTLLAVWLLRDPQGLIKFRGSSDFLLGHSLGVQSNLFSFAYLACGRSQPCMWIAGSVASLAVLAISAYMLWLNRARWTDWQAFSFIIPLGFLTALYLYQYDQILYIVPIIWIAVHLLARRRPYLLLFGALVAIDLVSLIALAATAYTHLDISSLATTLLVLAACLWLQRRSPALPVAAPSHQTPDT